MEENILEDSKMNKYPENMKVKTLTRDCFDGDSVTPEGIMLQEKYFGRFRELAHDFIEDCVDNQIESISQMGFFFTWLWPIFVEAQIDVCYDHLHDIGENKKVYRFEKSNEIS